MRTPFFLLTFAVSIAAWAVPARGGGLNIAEAQIDGKSHATHAPGEVFQFCAHGDIYLYSGSPDQHAYMMVLTKRADLPKRKVERSYFDKVAILSVLPLSHESGNAPICSYFRTPTSPGTYYLEYSLLPLFTKKPLGTQVTPDTIFVENPYSYPDVVAFLKEYADAWSELPQIALTVAPQAATTESPPAIVLQVNGQYPTAPRALIVPGYSDSPVVFGWNAYNAKGLEIEYRFGLFYTDTAFSDWTKADHAAYTFIYPGSHTFRVQGRYRKSPQQDWTEISEATYSFTIQKAFVSGSLAKGFGPTPTDTPPAVLPKDFYKRSIAVVIAVSKFDRGDIWQPLPFADHDAAAIAQALAAKNFEVRFLKEEPTSRNIIDFIDQTSNQTQLGDRVVLYFSTHGFKDKNSPNVYLASKDCDPDKVNTTCLPLSYIQDALSRIQQRAQHSLVVLDACSTGLGIITKSLTTEAFYESALLREPGAFMITAGMADEQAQTDKNGDMSEFTKFLVAGIGGEADLNKDGVVTLLELMTYVRGAVAKDTNSQQIPMMGRVSGDGEIMF